MVKHGMIRRGHVQFGTRRKTAIRQARREGITNDDPLPARRRGRLFPDVSENVLQRIQKRQRGTQFTGRGPRGMDMAIVQPRQDAVAVGVDHRGVRPAQFENGFVIA